MKAFPLTAALLFSLTVADRSLSGPAACTFEKEIGYHGNDIEPRILLGVPTVQDCCNRCLNNSACKAFSFMTNNWPVAHGSEYTMHLHWQCLRLIVYFCNKT